VCNSSQFIYINVGLKQITSWSSSLFQVSGARETKAADCQSAWAFGWSTINGIHHCHNSNGKSYHPFFTVLPPFLLFWQHLFFLTIVIACWHPESCLLLYVWTPMRNINYVVGYIHSLIRSQEKQFCLDMRLWNKYGASCRWGVSLILLVGVCFLRWWQLASHQDSTHP